MTTPGNRTRRHFLKSAGGGLLAAAAVPLAPPDAQPPKLKVPQAPTKKLGWAIVGLGQLAMEEIMPAFSQCEHSAPVALVSGHPDKAKSVAAHYGIDPKNIYDYKSYDSIKDNPAVDIIYIVLPNSMHAEYTIRGFKAGKHVLCEKPMSATVQEAQEMIDAAKAAQRKLMIAYRLRYEPFNQKMIELCRKKEHGPIRMIEAVNVQDVQAPNIRLSKALAGGPLGDVGVYCINAARYCTGEEPVEVSAMQFAAPDDPRFAEVPDRVTFELRFASGVLAHCGCGFSGAESRQYRVMCSGGWMQLDSAFAYSGQRMHVSHDQELTELRLAHVDHFASEMDHFSQCVRDNKDPLTPGEDGLADMKVMAAVQKSADTGGRVQV